jgi:hypothetical protein
MGTSTAMRVRALKTPQQPKLHHYLEYVGLAHLLPLLSGLAFTSYFDSLSAKLRIAAQSRTIVNDPP